MSMMMMDEGIIENVPPGFGDDEVDDGEDAVHVVPKAPPDSQWYHGRLDRSGAEERLRNCGREGSYLIRESDRKPGVYVLSYHGLTGINHFRIVSECGDFYIGGRQFNSLSDLVAYYTHLADLLKGERLLWPVVPPEPVNDSKRVIAILPYTKMPDTDELSFQKGDIFFVHNELGEGWLWVTAHRTGEQGTIFSELVEDLDAEMDPNTVFSWFHPNISKKMAVDMLVRSGPGAFLVRPSDNSPGDYSLFFHINSQIQRFRIEKRGVRYYMGGRTFDCLDAVIHRYRTEHIVEGHCLGFPVTKNDGDNETYVEKRKVERAEEIYATLRECREQSGIRRNQEIKMQGWLGRRIDKKGGKWKSLYFVLRVNTPETRLLYYDNPKRTKPKGLIDLACAHLYPVHFSLLEREHVFQLVERAIPCLATTTYLQADTPEAMQDWMTAIRPLCSAQNIRAPRVEGLRELRCLQIVILEANKVPAKLAPNPFCYVSLNGVRICKTRTKTGAVDPVFDEEFLLDDIPSDVTQFSVSVWNRGKRSKDTQVGEVTQELVDLGNQSEVERWFPLIGVTHMGEWGRIRLRVRFLRDLIMPLEEYSPLSELLLDRELKAVRALADLCYAERAPLAGALLRIFKHKRREAELLQRLTDAQLQDEEETGTLFRSCTLATTLMEIYMRGVCTSFLEHVLGPTLRRVMESKQSCELNPTKMENANDACPNAEFLLQVLDDLTDAMFMSADACPRTVRYLCGCLQSAAAAKFPKEKLVRTRVISGFIFLRLLCPAILNPRQFNLYFEPLYPHANRSLIMIAKCLQNLANLVEFGSKEPYMEVLNPFILKNKERMIIFLENLSNVREMPPSEDVHYDRNDPARDLATLHHICRSHLGEIQQRSQADHSLRRLVTVTEMLQKHKEKYMEKLG
ncbi:unnamed protein product [Cyprideis torosa]|uniref:Uncharacterized protein n=1 Tax=Cyprideis torosa TaxID=163714 RepID=A0A7R8ZM80_9CRUS|nr:unnamed protein product [Cyprideis torosa]CAG0885228.1 unnamed protein product [Cyprideis torosa]